jgi:hypothetical protein
LRYADTFANLDRYSMTGARSLTNESVTKPQPARRGSWGCAVFPAVLLGGFIWFMQHVENNPTDPCRDDLGALSAARGFVTERLKAPSTASFASYDGKNVRVEKLADCRFQVFGQFDAENGFGAMLRGNYAATVETSHSGGWRLISIDIR